MSGRGDLHRLVHADRPDWVEVCLAIAAEADPALDAGACRDRVDAIARDAAARGGDVDAVVAAMRATGLRGDDAEYDDPRNSLLPEVLRRGRGLPIALSMLTVAVADRVGVAMDGVGLPGHFVVTAPGPPARWFDAFAGWAPLSSSDCLAIAGPGADPRVLAPADPVAIAQRMLANLRMSYLRRRMLRDALWTAELGLVVDPGCVPLARELPAFLAGVGRYADAEEAAAAYLAGHPDAPDRAEVERLLGAVRELQGRMN